MRGSMETPSFVQHVSISPNRFTRPLCSAPSAFRRFYSPRTFRAVASISCCLESEINDELENELEALEGTELKWAEIDFPTIEDELRAIDEYVKEEDIDEDDCWPVFLRAGAYESRGQSQLALAQLSKIEHKAGIAKVPNLWERRAYNAFKTGDIARANAYFDVSLRVYYDAVGNELHFAHWFEENFKSYMPKHNGPAFSFQRGICKYCVGMLQEARGFFVSGLIIGDIGSEHAVLWLLASAVRSSPTMTVPDSDLTVVNDWREEGEPVKDSTLGYCLELYVQGATGSDSNVDDLLRKLSGIAEGTQSEESLTAVIYLALFYDSISRNEELRDLWLEKIAALPGGPANTSTLDFVYHAAKYRFSGSKVNIT